MPCERELAVAKAAVRAACALCADVQPALGQDGRRDKADQSPVTVADYGAQALVFRALAKAFPQDPAVGEEDAEELAAPEQAALRALVVDRVRRYEPALDEAAILALLARGRHPGGPAGRFWTLDPIDGTKGFLRGEQYAVALALVEGGVPILGVLGCPNLPADPANPDGPRGLLVHAAKGGGSCQERLDRPDDAAPIRCDAVSDPSQAVLCESVESGHTKHDRARRIAAALGVSAPPLRMDSQCKYAAVARGQASAYLRLPTRPGYQEKIWDHAAGALVLQEAGGRIADTLGQPLDFSQGRTLARNKGVVAASPGVFDAVLEAARAAVEA